MNKLLTLFFSSLITFVSYSQEIKKPKLMYSIGYYGETITHTGINFGIEYYPFQNDKFQMILATNVGGYVHKRNNSSLFIREQWGQRVTFKNGIFIDEFLGVGYLHHFTHGGEIYEVLPNGAVISSPNNGRSMIMPSVAIGTGYDFSKKTKTNLIFYIRPELFWKAPFNGYYLTHLALNTGFILKLNNK